MRKVYVVCDEVDGVYGVYTNRDKAESLVRKFSQFEDRPLAYTDDKDCRWGWTDWWMEVAVLDA